MSSRLSLEAAALDLEVGVHKIRQHHRQRDQRAKNIARPQSADTAAPRISRPARKAPASSRGKTAFRNTPRRRDGARACFCGDADLPDVVCAEGRRHRYALRLTEGVILHGADEIHHHLRYLVRRALRQQRGNTTAAISTMMNSVSQRITCRRFYVIRRAFRQKRAQKIGAYRYHVIQRPVPVHAAKLYGEQHHVRRLRALQNTPPRIVYVNPPKNPPTSISRPNTQRFSHSRNTSSSWSFISRAVISFSVISTRPALLLLQQPRPAPALSPGSRI